VLPPTVQELKESKKFKRDDVKLKMPDDVARRIGSTIDRSSAADSHSHGCSMSEDRGTILGFGGVDAKTVTTPHVWTARKFEHRKQLKPILLTAARKKVREELLADIVAGPKRRVHFKIIRSRSRSAWNPLEPNSVLVKSWLQAMLFPTTWEVWAFPFRLAFCEIAYGQGRNMWVLNVDLAADVMFICDIFAGFGIVIPAGTYPQQEHAATTFAQIIPLRLRQQLHWQLFPIAIYQLISVILLHGGWLGAPHTAVWLWWASAVPRLIQRMLRFSNYFESILVDPTINAKQLQFVRYCQPMTLKSPTCLLITSSVFTKDSTPYQTWPTIWECR
jgi:hypothetical protein